MKTKKQLQQLLTQNQIVEVLRALKEVSANKPELHRKVLQLQTRYNKLKRTEQMGTHELEKLRIAENQISQALFECIEEAFVQESTTEKKTKASVSSKRKLSSRDLTYAIRYAVSHIFRKPAQNGFIWLLLVTTAILLIFPSFLQWVEADDSFTKEWNRFQSPLRWGVFALLVLLFLIKIQKLLQKSLKLNRLNIADTDHSPIKGCTLLTLRTPKFLSPYNGLMISKSA